MTSHATGPQLLDPVSEVQGLAVELGQENDVRVITWSVCTPPRDIAHALTECMQSGKWLVLENMHLAGVWEPQTLDIFKVRYDNIRIDNIILYSGAI